MHLGMRWRASKKILSKLRPRTRLMPRGPRASAVDILVVPLPQPNPAPRARAALATAGYRQASAHGDRPVGERKTLYTPTALYTPYIQGFRRALRGSRRAAKWRAEGRLRRENRGLGLTEVQLGHRTESNGDGATTACWGGRGGEGSWGRKEKRRGSTVERQPTRGPAEERQVSRLRLPTHCFLSLLKINKEGKHRRCGFRLS